MFLFYKMPESPEISYLANYINKHLISHILKSIEILDGRYKHHEAPENVKEFRQSLPLRLTKVAKKGKVLFIYFDKWCLISKLGMTGWWFIPGDAPTWRKANEDIVLTFDNNKLIFSDMRYFGTLTITNNPIVIEKELTKIAPDILDPNTNFNLIKHQLTQLSTSKLEHTLIEDILVDQKLIMSGIGNYLKAEILYAAKISPLRKLKSLTIEDFHRIFTNAKRIAEHMLKVNLTNKYFDSMRVYMREKDLYGNPVVTHKTKTGRTTYWVPNVQK